MACGNCGGDVHYTHDCTSCTKEKGDRDGGKGTFTHPEFINRNMHLTRLTGRGIINKQIEKIRFLLN